MRFILRLKASLIIKVNLCEIKVNLWIKKIFRTYFNAIILDTWQGKLGREFQNFNRFYETTFQLRDQIFF